MTRKKHPDWKGAVAEVLSRHKEALSPMQICAELLAEDNCPWQAKTPWNSASANIYHHIKEAGKDALFMRPVLGKQLFALSDKGRDYLVAKGLLKNDVGMLPLFEPQSLNKAWWLTANPREWSFGSLAEGGEMRYSARTESGKRVRRYFNKVQVGDKLVCYEAAPTLAVVALATVVHVEPNEFLNFRLERFLSHPLSYAMLKDDVRLQGHSYFRFPQGTLFPLTHGEYEAILEHDQQNIKPVEEEVPAAAAPAPESYSKADFLDDVFWDAGQLETMLSLLKRKKNIILQGAPGVGKSYAAKRLAYTMMGCKDADHVRLIQFHQSYTYEDFVQGYKPSGSGFEAVKGVFYQFCQKAQNDADRDYFLLIDEINRGNLSKIFGELLMLIEASHRGESVILSGSGEPFFVPKNLYIIGMMNTADRSLAMVDYALRRRFSFCTLEPAFESAGFRRSCADVWDNPVFQGVLSRVQELNRELAEQLGAGYCIGHSFLCRSEDDEADVVAWLRQVVEFDIIPLLEEYWFDEPDQIKQWSNSLRHEFAAAT